MRFRQTQILKRGGRAERPQGKRRHSLTADCFSGVPQRTMPRSDSLETCLLPVRRGSRGNLAQGADESRRGVRVGQRFQVKGSRELG
jgi:hypothetical protein